MVRSIHIVVPKTELESTLQVLSTSENVHGLATFYGDGVSMLIFKSDERKLQHTLKRLNNIGVGVRFGTIDVHSLVTSLPSIRRHQGASNKQYRIDDRMSVEEIQDAIDSQSRLTFDFLAMTAIAAVLSGTGLVGDSSTTVVASMLVSPLMGPILCLTFGIAADDKTMFKRGLVNVACGLGVCIGIGIIIGICALPYYFNDDGLPHDWNEFVSNTDLAISSEIIERGTPAGLVMGFAIALPSGVGVTLAVTTSSGINSLVGVAIASALIPPVVNCGICVTAGLFLSMVRSEKEIGHNFVVLGGVSFLLFLINIVTMVVVGIGMMKLKNITTAGGNDEKWNNEMFSAGGERSSFFRSGVELQTREELDSPTGRPSEPLLEGSRMARGSDPYTGWFGDGVKGGEMEDERGGGGGGGGVAVGAGSSLMSFMLNATKILGREDEKGLRNRANSSGEKKRDSVDMFSPNNFDSDLMREMRKSLGGGDWEGMGVEEDGDEGVVFGAGEGGEGFRIAGEDEGGSGEEEGGEGRSVERLQA